MPNYQVGLQLLFCCVLSYKPLCNSFLVELKFLKGKDPSTQAHLISDKASMALSGTADLRSAHKAMASSSQSEREVRASVMWYMWPTEASVFTRMS